MNATEILAFGNPVVGSTRGHPVRRDNAQAIADCHQLGYLPGTVFDATYGLGRFWKRHTPKELVTNDINAETPAEHHHDFRSLPYMSNEWETVVFDPPYKLNGTSTGRGPAVADDGYGVGGAYSSVAEKHQLMIDGLRECIRVASHFVLAKCQDQVCNGEIYWQTDILTEAVRDYPCRKIDALYVWGWRPQPPGRRQVHARRDFSTLLVFEKRG